MVRRLGRTGSLCLLAMAASSGVFAQTGNDVARNFVASPHAAAAGVQTTDFVRIDGDEIVRGVTGMLTATPGRRAADVALGVALTAIGSRPRHPMSPMVAVGMRAIRLGIASKSPGRSGGYEVIPQVGRRSFAVSIRAGLG
jgi:hypothetical protein